MSAPFYVPPEQLIRDRAEFARKGIARGRSVVVLSSAEGIVLVAENPSATLHKIAEIYDRIGFAAVGKFNEFEQLRQAGVRYADLRGYTYDRADVTARGLANAYAQTLAAAFTTESKPLEVELVVAELGAEQAGDRLYRIGYDGSIADEHGFVCLGGAPEAIAAVLRENWRTGLSRAEALALGADALRAGREESPALEEAVLDRGLIGGRTFRRLARDEADGGDEGESWKRIFGIETEYGLAYTQRTGRRLGPEELAGHLFRGIVDSWRSSNVFLPNGARLYLDVGSHPEFASAECDRLDDLLAQDRAGETLLLDMLATAQEAIAAEGHDGTVHLLKNNADAVGNSYGCHENYLIRRTVDFTRLTTALLPFLVCRQLLVGAGAIIPAQPPGARGEAAPGEPGEPVYGYSGRSDVMWEGVSSATTRSRPIINARDEPHADAAQYRRLHVIVGDSNRAEPTTLLKLGSTGLVIDLIESGVALDSLALKDPIVDIRMLARDAAGTRLLQRKEGGTITAPAVLEYLLEQASALVGRGDHSLGDDAIAAEVLDLWARTIAAVRSGDHSGIDTEIDWAIKARLLERYRVRHGLPLSDPRLIRLELAYHDLTPGAGVFPGLRDAGLVRELTDGQRVARAREVPPATTRAALRGEFIRRAKEAGSDFTVDWVHLRLNDRAQRAVVLKDPFSPLDERVEHLISLI